ncbi:fluoride efflux transporter FluC [Halobellus ruber]|uniref:Fluoride-specific ion channel FluC n=1 Tax=Halobellus ruber TaxID=2761102 RepID=A0A7J9SMA4_9EURY|nr:CrcB family protein [Halobellus ruber]MBB6647137.1 CrcB family protein [Halobellus ruber]
MADRLTPVVVALGGFLGAVSRYLVGTAVAGPEGILLVNASGSFALAATVGVTRSRRLRLFLTTGLLSSFTTYSTFAVESASLGVAGGTAYVVATYALGVAAAALGLAFGRRAP